MPPLSAAGLRVMKLLVGNPPQTITDLIRAAGVTRTAVTEQLNELVGGRFCGTKHGAAARPRPAAPPLSRPPTPRWRCLFASNQRLVVPAIWRAIDEIGDEELANKIRKRVSHLLAEHYRSKITAKRPLRTAPAVLRPVDGRGWTDRGRGRRPGAIGAPQTELPFHQHGRPAAKRLPHRSGHDECGRRAAGPPDGLPPRRRPVLHVRDRRRKMKEVVIRQPLARRVVISAATPL